jgi:hypothetical protein
MRLFIFPLALVLYSRGTMAGDSVTLIADKQCVRDEKHTAPHYHYVELDEVVANIRDYYGAAHSGSDARWLGDGQNAVCSGREQQAIREALLRAIVQPEFFHQRDFLDTLQVMGPQSWVTAFEALLAQPDLPPFARPRVEAAVNRLRQKFPKK